MHHVSSWFCLRFDDDGRDEDGDEHDGESDGGMIY